MYKLAQEGMVPGRKVGRKWRLGMADNGTGRIIGVATPLLLLVFKEVMVHCSDKYFKQTTQEGIVQAGDN